MPRLEFFARYVNWKEKLRKLGGKPPPLPFHKRGQLNILHNMLSTSVAALVWFTSRLPQAISNASVLATNFLSRHLKPYGNSESRSRVKES